MKDWLSHMGGLEGPHGSQLEDRFAAEQGWKRDNQWAAVAVIQVRDRAVWNTAVWVLGPRDNWVGYHQKGLT